MDRGETERSWLRAVNFRRTVCYRTADSPARSPPRNDGQPVLIKTIRGSQLRRLFEWHCGRHPVESFGNNSSRISSFSSSVSTRFSSSSSASFTTSGNSSDSSNYSRFSSILSLPCLAPPRLSWSDHDEEDQSHNESSTKMYSSLDSEQGTDCCSYYPGDAVVKCSMVDLSQLHLGERFACGASSRVYRGIYYGKEVAVKIIRLSEDTDNANDRLEHLFHEEVTLLSQLSHPNIVQFMGACKKSPTLCVITEYLRGGSLKSFLNKRNGEALPLWMLLEMALNICCGMEYVHANGVIHRDLKSDNLVLTEDLQVKLTDFGSACLESDLMKSCRRDDVKAEGTYRWMAPEILHHYHYSRKVDVYSFGIVLWELLTTKTPFQDMTPVQAAFAVSHKNARPPIPTDCPVEVKKLLQQCWALNPHQRPEFGKIRLVLQKRKDSLQKHHGATGI